MNTIHSARFMWALALLLASCGNTSAPYAPKPSASTPATNSGKDAGTPSLGDEPSTTTPDPATLSPPQAATPPTTPATTPEPAAPPAAAPAPAEVPADAGTTKPSDAGKIDPFALLPDLGGTSAGACVTCMKNQCATAFNACTADSECMKSFTCALKTCDVASVKNGPNAGLQDCVVNCFQSSSGLRQQGEDSYNCAIGTCGSSCESLAGSFR